MPKVKTLDGSVVALGDTISYNDEDATIVDIYDAASNRVNLRLADGSIAKGVVAGSNDAPVVEGEVVEEPEAEEEVNPKSKPVSWAKKKLKKQDEEPAKDEKQAKLSVES